jgi:hypothetical protein
MRKILATAATLIALTGAANAQVVMFQGSGPGGAGTGYMGGGWNNCANCGMGGASYYGQWMAQTNGMGAGMRGWGGVPSANNYGAGYMGPPMGAILGAIFGGGW